MKNNKPIFEKAKLFWKNYSEKAELSDHSLMNLEPSSDRAKDKLDFEMTRVFSKLFVAPDMKVVDLGGGVGFWSKRFCEVWFRTKR